jgi:dimeric dUTPase (all-alpha-NTP-PPase superfamily)
VDKLEAIFTLQASFQEKIKKERHLEDIPMEKWLQMQTLAMVSELAEVLDAVNFKWWKNPHPLDNANIREELCDLLHFLVGMCLETGMTADDLYDVYVGKNRENFRRQDGMSEKKGYEVQAAADGESQPQA